MKIIKFKKKEKFKYKRKVIIKDLILNISIGIHNFEKKKKQRVKFNIEILTNPYVLPNSKDLNSILDWVEQLNEVNTDKVEPLSNISSSILPKREDLSNDVNSSEEILENAPDKLEGFFAVPKVVE